MKDYFSKAIRNIALTGDTDIFPFPVEKYLFEDMPDKVEQVLLQLDKDFESLTPNGSGEALEVTLPVGYTGFRRATMIDPIWNAYYLAEVLKIAKQIESKRIPVKDNSVFSYRLKYDEEKGTLFDKEVSWKKYFENAGNRSRGFSHVVLFDIADFYKRVSHASLKDVLLNDVQADPVTVERIMSLLGHFSGNNSSTGLPIGGNASRILAEALLSRSDRFFTESGYASCRFVDDIILFADSEQNAYSMLNASADYFLGTMGLSLQKKKTQIMRSKEFARFSRSIIDEIETDKEKNRQKDRDRVAVMRLNSRIDPYSLVGDDDLKGSDGEITGEGIIRLLKSECRKVRINQVFSKQLLRTIRALKSKEKSEAMVILSDNFVKMYPLFPLIMRTAHHQLPKCSEEAQKVFIEKLQELFREKSFVTQTENNAAYALRVLALGKDEGIPGLIDEIHAAYADSRKGTLVKMNAIYAMIYLKNSEWILDKLKRSGDLSSWERRALLTGAAHLGITVEEEVFNPDAESTPLEKLVTDWISFRVEKYPDYNLPL